MAVQIEGYPHYGTEDDKILWYQKMADSLNELSVTGAGAGGVGDVDVDPDTGRILAMPPGAAEPIFLGYAYRYLHVRLSSSSDGTTLVNPTTFTGSTLYIGTFNSESPATPGAAANFVYSPFNWGASRQLSYRTIGGRNILFNAGIVVPDGNTEISASTAIVDLEVANQGAVGAQGRFEVQVYQNAASQPATPTGGTFINGNLTAPMGWDTDFPSTNMPMIWQSVATVDPSVSTTSVNEISTLTTTGVTGGLVTTPAVAEEGFFDLSGVPGDDVAGAQQVSTLSFNGETGETTVVPGTPEVQTLTASGTRSNVVGTQGSNELITVKLFNNFNSGHNQTNEVITLNNFGSITQAVGDNFDFPDGTPTGLPAGFTYEPSRFTPPHSSEFTASGRLSGDSSTRFNLSNSSMSATVTVANAPAGGSDLEFRVGFGGSSNTSNRHRLSVESGMTYTFNIDFSAGFNQFFGGSSADLRFTFYVASNSDLPITYSVDSIVINTGDTSATSYVFDIDQSDAIYAGDVSGTFSSDSDNNASLAELGTAVTTMFPAISVSTAIDDVIRTTLEPATRTARETGTLFSSNEWDLRDPTTSPFPGTSVAYASWSDWVNQRYYQRRQSGTFRSQIVAYFNRNLANPRVGTVEFTIGSATATFNATAISLNSTSESFSLGSLISSTGTPPTTGSITTVLTTHDGARSITFDTGTTTDITSSLLLTRNTGLSLISEISAVDGGSPDPTPHSSYTVNDYDGNEVTSFTSSVPSGASSDSASVINQIVAAINTNVETPIDFMAAVSGNVITLTAQTGGSVTGIWSVVVNHFTGNGDLGFAALVTTEGTDDSTTGTLTNWILNTPGGQFTDTFTTDSDANSQALQVESVVLAQNPPYYTTSVVGTQLVLTSVDELVGTPITANWSTNGTNQTAINPQIVTNNPGITAADTQDSITLNFPDSASTTLEFRTGETTAQAGAELSNITVQGIRLSVDNGYSTMTNPLASGSTRIRYTYLAGGVRTDASSSAVTITQGDTSGTLATTAPTVVTQGAAAFTSGTLTTYSIALNPEHSATPLTGMMPDSADAVAQAAFLAGIINPLPGITAAVGDRTNEVVLVQSAGARTDETVVTYSTNGTNQTATSPVTLVTRQGVDGASQLSAWSAPFEVGAEGPPGMDGTDGIDAVQTQLQLTDGTLEFKNNAGMGTLKAVLIIGETIQADFGLMGSPINSYNWYVTPRDTQVRQLVTNGNVASLTGTTANDTHRGTDANDAFPYHSLTVEADGTALGVTAPGHISVQCEIDYN